MVGNSRSVRLRAGLSPHLPSLRQARALPTEDSVASGGRNPGAKHRLLAAVHTGCRWNSNPFVDAHGGSLDKQRQFLPSASSNARCLLNWSEPSPRSDHTLSRCAKSTSSSAVRAGKRLLPILKFTVGRTLPCGK